MDLSQLASGIATASTARATVPMLLSDGMRRASWRGDMSEPKVVGEAGHERRGPTNVAAVDRARDAEVEPQVRQPWEEVHDVGVSDRGVHAVGHERHVLAPDVTAAEGALPGDADGDAPGAALPADAAAVHRHVRHRDLVRLDVLTVGVVRTAIERHVRAPHA